MSVYCMDCKVVVDDHSVHRQQEVFACVDHSEEDELEKRAAKANLNFIKLTGDIGCMGAPFCYLFLLF